MAAISPNNIAGDQEQAETEAEAAAVGPDVTRHIQLKSSQVLEKAVVLRRIRHRKRVSKFKAVVGALFSSPFTDQSADSGHRKWADEPFTSL